MKTKVNPRRRPATQADVQRAKDEATNRAVIAVWAIALTVLRDKEGFDKDRLAKVWNEALGLSDSISQGYINIQDLLTVLREEAGIDIKGGV